MRGHTSFLVYYINFFFKWSQLWKNIRVDKVELKKKSHATCIDLFFEIGEEIWPFINMKVMYSEIKSDLGVIKPL